MSLVMVPIILGRLTVPRSLFQPFNQKGRIDRENEHEAVYQVDQRVFKNIESHMYAVALNFMFSNFVRVHKTLTNPYTRTPAMASGIADHI